MWLPSLLFHQCLLISNDLEDEICMWDFFHWLFRWCLNNVIVEDTGLVDGKMGILQPRPLKMLRFCKKNSCHYLKISIWSKAFHVGLSVSLSFIRWWLSIACWATLLICFIQFLSLLWIVLDEEFDMWSFQEVIANNDDQERRGDCWWYRE